MRADEVLEGGGCGGGEILLLIELLVQPVWGTVFSTGAAYSIMCCATMCYRYLPPHDVLCVVLP